MKGTLAEGILPGLLRSLYVGRKSGKLSFTTGEVRRSVRFEHGQIVRAESNLAEEHLGEIMVRHNMLTQADLERATDTIIKEGKRLGVVLREMGQLDDDKLQDVLSVQVHEILLKVFSMTEGEFEFEETAAEAPVDGDRTLKVSTGELILEAVDRVRDPGVVRRSLGDMHRVLALPTDPLLRFQKVTLTPTDGYILSRVDGVMSALEIVQMLGLPEDDVCRSLLGLLSTGLVEYKAAVRKDGAGAPKPKAPSAHAPAPPAAAAAPAPPPPQAAKPAQAPPPVAPPPVAPPPPPAPPAPPPPAPRVETAEDRRKEIVEAWNGIKTRTHYEVLGLGLDATPVTVKEAYFKLAKRFHPDVHTDPALADLRDKLDAIFIRLGQAYEALKDVKPRMAPKPAAPSAPAVPEPTPSEPPPPAAPAILDPRVALEAIAKADRFFIQEKYWDAIQALEGILGNAPPKPLSKARLLLAKCYLKNPNWVRRAEEQLQLLLKAEPKNVEANYQLAKIYANGGLKGRAVALLKKVLELKPDHEEAFADLTQLAPPPDEEPQNQGFLKKLFGKG
jgi:hypothetical protein